MLVLERPRERPTRIVPVPIDVLAPRREPVSRIGPSLTDLRQNSPTVRSCSATSRPARLRRARRVFCGCLDRPCGWEERGAVRKVIRTQDVPGSPLYSQAVKAGGHVYVSGMVGLSPATGALVGPSIGEQTKQAMRNCEVVLVVAGATLGDVVEVGVLLSRSEDFEGMNEEYAAWFPSDPPARYVARLGVDLAGVLVSVRMTAYLG